jgi:hypothetical protein
MTSLLLPSKRLLSPTFTRESISWRTVSPGIVEIAVDLENPGSEPTSPGDLVVETAGLGAFVPFRPVTRIALGSLEPGERRRATARVPQGRLAAPQTVATLAAAWAQVAQRSGSALKPEVIDLISHSQWVGNLNVYFDRRPENAVEVHRAFDLRVRAGQPVMTMVDVPTDQKEYDVLLRCSDPAWKTQSVRFFNIFFVILQPPAVGSRVEVTIEVTRLSDRRMVPVELSLESVAGEGTSLGCVSV